MNANMLLKRKRADRKGRRKERSEEREKGIEGGKRERGQEEMGGKGEILVSNAINH